MKTFVSTALQAHMASPAPTLAWYWHLNLDNNTVFGFTTHTANAYVPTKLPLSQPIFGYVPGGIMSLSNPGFTPTDIAMTSSLSQNNLDITSLLDDLGITEIAIRAKSWNAAKFEIGFFNYNDLTMGTNTVAMGTLGGFDGGDQTVKIEQRGLSQPLEANMDGVTGPMCRVKLGSMGPGMCNKDITSFLRTGTVAGWVADRLFIDPARTEADDWWTKGLITFTSGDSIGLTFEVKHSLANGTIELVEESFLGFANGDAYSISPGCNKLLKIPGPADADGNPTVVYEGDCKIKYDNVVNMQAEPETPGQIAIQQYGGQTVAASNS